VFLCETVLKRRTIQSYVEFRIFPLDKSVFPSAVNNRFRNYRLRDSLRNEVRNEENRLDILDIISGCSGTA
jgi:hypothetical protein